LDAHPEHERAHQRHKDRNIGKKRFCPICVEGLALNVLTPLTASSSYDASLLNALVQIDGNDGSLAFRFWH
jgi:hypothetical protein